MSFAPVEPLKPGDVVAVVAPASPFDLETFERGLALLATRYTPHLGAHARDVHRYLAGRDVDRATDLQRALTDESVRAVFTARGGYGSARLLPSLQLARVRKPIVGFSDITSVHCALQSNGRRSVHGPVLTQLGRAGAAVAAPLFDLLEGALPPLFTALRRVVPGVAQGALLGGNLSVLSRLIGTPWLPSLRGAVLLLEDVGERPYRLDRMWTHLKLAGALDGIAGVAFGEFAGCDDPAFPSEVVLDELARDLGVPCLGGLAIGHGEVNLAVPLGAQVRLDADNGTLEFLEGLCT